MSANYDRQPEFSVPPAPSSEAGASTQTPENSPDQLVQSPEVNRGSMQPVATPLSTQPLQPIPAAGSLPQAQASSNSQSQDNATPAVADDKDLIEKEWVDKAKRIVEKTKDDPYQQTKQINRFKADYLKKRYNRELKIEE